MPILIKGSGGKKAKLQQKTATPTTSSQTISPDSGYDGLSKVTVSGVDIVATSVDVVGVTGEYTGKSISFDMAGTFPHDRYPDVIYIVFLSKFGYVASSGSNHLFSAYLLKSGSSFQSTYSMYGSTSNNGFLNGGTAVCTELNGSKMTIQITMPTDLNFYVNTNSLIKYSCAAVWSKTN